ncbi:MAG: hypothetical protein IAF58_00195, partial [Leptolyngbya sp.]|nr:hypothetical protein [Candidatus Melainabacteria bacterium]
MSLTGVQAFLRDDLEQFCRTAPPGTSSIHSVVLSLLTLIPEFTEHQRAVFCVFSSDGVNGLRNHLNQLERQASFDPDEMYQAPGDAEQNVGQAMILDDDGADADEELDDADGSPGLY